MPSVSQADLAFTAQILYPTFRTYGNSFQETYRDMHLISRNGSLPLSERLQVLFILIFLFLLVYLYFLLHPLPCFCCLPWAFPASQRRKDLLAALSLSSGKETMLPYPGCFLQHSFTDKVSVTNAAMWLPCRLCFPDEVLEEGWVAHVA